MSKLEGYPFPQFLLAFESLYCSEIDILVLHCWLATFKMAGREELGNIYFLTFLVGESVSACTAASVVFLLFRICIEDILILSNDVEIMLIVIEFE